MGSLNRLNSKDREFFSLVAKVIFTNPFSREWEEIKNFAKYIEKEGDTKNEYYLNALFEPLNDRICQLEGKKRINLDSYSGEDRILMKHAILFHVYRRYVSELDKLIQAQLQMKSGLLKVSFAKKLIGELTGRGFSDEDAIRYLGIFYQLRRGFYFISHSLIGESPSMKQLRLALWNNVFTYDVRIYDQHLWNRMEDFSTMLLGETGTGKGAAAMAIGRSAFIPFDPTQEKFHQNFNETCIAINLSQYPETLIESELFGHSKGAFTGAVENHKGLFERCSSHGCLFLDEIGDVSIPIQIKLLKVLQERTFTPVGSHSENKFSGRVIAATNRPLEKLRKENHFRDDFFYRLCSDIIDVPTLRKRIQESSAELESLVQLLVLRMVGEESTSLVDMVLEALNRDLPKDYSWPGNVRELEQAVRRVLLSRHYAPDFTPFTDLDGSLVSDFKNGNLKVTELLNYYCTSLYKKFGTYEEVAKRTGLDRRTAKKYIQQNSSE